MKNVKISNASYGLRCLSDVAANYGDTVYMENCTFNTINSSAFHLHYANAFVSNMGKVGYPVLFIASIALGTLIGTYIDVEGTIFDFRKGAPLKQVLTLDHDQTKGSLGVDQNFCVDREEGKFTLVATLEDDKSSRKMEVLTDMPGLQIYAGNHLGGNLQKGDIPYKQYGAVCLEAQMYPNAVNIPEFSTPIIKKGQTTYHACGYRFN